MAKIWAHLLRGSVRPHTLLSLRVDLTSLTTSVADHNFYALSRMLHFTVFAPPYFTSFPKFSINLVRFWEFTLLVGVLESFILPLLSNFSLVRDSFLDHVFHIPCSLDDCFESVCLFNMHRVIPLKSLGIPIDLC